jgi:hypothetical protein
MGGGYLGGVISEGVLESGVEGGGLLGAGSFACTLITAYAMRHCRFDRSADAVAWLRLARPGRRIAVQHTFLQEHSLQARHPPPYLSRRCGSASGLRDVGAHLV